MTPTNIVYLMLLGAVVALSVVGFLAWRNVRTDRIKSDFQCLSCYTRFPAGSSPLALIKHAGGGCNQ